MSGSGLKAAKRGDVPPFIVMDVMRAANEKAAGGAHVLHLEVGQPGTPAPSGVLRAAHRALDEERLGYTDSKGLPSLRQRIARHYADAYSVTVDPERIMVTTGSSGGFLLAFLAAFDEGDRVALAAPGYPAYRNIMTALGLEPVVLECEMEDRFQPTVELLERAGRVDGMIIASPSNPAGTMLGRQELETLGAYCEANGIRLVSDEIYHGISFGAPAVTALDIVPSAIVVNSFSKYYSMTGWRLGWMVLPEALVRPVECLSQNLFISAPALSQIAGEAAFDCGAELDAIVDGYARNRELLLRRLPEAGLDRLAPADGAFYIYADVRAFTNDSAGFCQRMLAETAIAATAGVDFDPGRGHHYVRFSFAGTTEDMNLAATRLKDWLPIYFP